MVINGINYNKDDCYIFLKGDKTNMLKYLLSCLVIIILSGCGLFVNSYDTPELAIKHEMDSKDSDHFSVKKIITVGKDFAFFVSKADSISVAYLKKSARGWEVTGATGGRYLNEIDIQDSKISPSLSLSDERILYGFLNDATIESLSYKSVNGHIIDLAQYVPNKPEYKGLKLWYIALPEGQKMSLEDADQVIFKNNKGELIPYKK